MKIRHRVPTIFNIYMLDVICCSLGCVILLWQANNQKLRESEENYTAANAQVASLRTELQSLQIDVDKRREREYQMLRDLEKIRLEKDSAEKLVLLRQQDYDKARAALTIAEGLLKNVRTDFESLKTENKLKLGELADKVRANAELLLKLAESEKALEAASKRFAVTDSRTKDLEKNLLDLKTDNKITLDKLNLANIKVLALEKDLDASQKDSKDKGTLVLARVKDLKEAEALIESLKNKNKAILEAAERRFAGVTLNGKRVIFLVDMSGSMSLKDVNLEDPDKWPEVCEAIGKVLHSMSDVEHFQVILFSDRIRYLFENQKHRWLIYDGPETSKLVVSQLKKIKPAGETNLFAAFDEAFVYRQAGLDAIYLFSDGLPSAGEGLPASGVSVSEQQKTELLSKHIRSKLKNDWNRVTEGKRVRINTIGFFFESPEVGAFLWALARDNDGSFVGMSRP